MSGSAITVDPVILLYAARYALGRRTGAPSEVAVHLLAHRDAIPERMRAQLVREIADAIQAGCAGDVWRRVLVAYDATGA